MKDSLEIALNKEWIEKSKSAVFLSLFSDGVNKKTPRFFSPDRDLETRIRLGKYQLEPWSLQ